MTQVIIITIVRFDSEELATNKLYAFDEHTDLSTAKKAVIGYLGDMESEIVPPYEGSDGEAVKSSNSSVEQQDRQDTFDRIVHDIKSAESIKDFARHSTLNDGCDEDTGAELFSYINITIESLIKL